MTAKKKLFQKLREENAFDDSSNRTGIRYSLKLKVAVVLFTVLFCALFFNIHFEKSITQASNYSLAPGYLWPGRTLTAEFTFPIFKQEIVYKEEVKKAVDNLLPVFVYDKTAKNEALTQLDVLLSNIKEQISTKDPTDLLTPTQFKYLTQKSETQINTELNSIKNILEQYLIDTYKSGFISMSVNSLKRNEISVRVDASGEVIFRKSALTDSISFLENAETVINRRLTGTGRAVALRLLSRLMIPNMYFSTELTNNLKELTSQSVAKTTGIVHKGEVIIRKGDRVTQFHLNKLLSYDKSLFMKSDDVYDFWNFLGSYLHAFMLYSLLLVFLFVLRKRIFYDNMQLGILSLILIFISFISWLSIQITTRFPIEYALILPALSMLVAIVFDSRTAFYMTVIMSLYVAGIRGNDYETSTAMLIAGALGAYTVRDIQSRTQMYKSFFLILLGFLLPIVAFGLERSADTMLTVYRFIIATINAAFSPLITFGLLFLLERFSNIATDLRIKEYDNLSHTLLQKLNEIAPGTYQHTMAVAILTERCTAAIGGNSLLAKVGAYFHDIGKIGKPEYFAENEADMKSKHDQLSPRKSAEAIKEHVTNGIALAEQYNLPRRIINFIPMHHGTTLIKHFYAKALEENPDGNVKESDFRYPGPKPNNKETAVLMICDSAEAISRLFENDKEKFEAALKKIIDEKLLDGQFDESDITIKDLNKIRETCIKNLMGMSHKRKAYKEIPDKNNKPDA